VTIQTLRQRERGEPASPLEPGVPDWLKSPLLGWIHASTQDMTRQRRLTTQLRLTLPSGTGLSQYLAQSNLPDPEIILDATDLLLKLLYPPPTGFPGQITVTGSTGPQPPRELTPAEKLQQVLDDAGSAYRVSDDRRQLLRRVAETAEAAAQRAIAEADTAGNSAGLHLREAWSCAYGRSPDPSKSYWESIKAVESALASKVTPNDRSATLGKLLPELRLNQLNKWQLPIADENGDPTIKPLIYLAARLWTSQSDRHGGVEPTIRPPQAEAEEAVQLAVTLVQLTSLMTKR
jgi:hypothetical protein